MSRFKMRVCCVIIFAFLYSAFAAYGELYYWLWGKTIEAQLVDVHGAKERDGTSFQYSFMDGDKHRTEIDIANVDGPIKKEGTITVQYIPGDTDYSRIYGHREMGAVYFFFGCLALMLIFIGLIVREANAPIPI
jgi:hypothetical protein